MPARPLREIETWIFDLDNTLYPSSCALYREVEARMTAFIMAELRLDSEAAHGLRRRFFEQHGTTLRGLMLDYGLEPKRFLDFVHELDLSPVPRDPELAAAIAALPGRKIIFTNGTARHAERLLAHLELTDAFSGIHDIVACDYVPKPDPSGYRLLMDRHALAGKRTAMVEDMAKNLAPAAALGMTTIWVMGGPHAHPAEGEAEHIHHVVEDATALAAFLAAIPLTPAAE
ncbi:MAG TPA: pyrimidine 5'-nucleotidase [Stellaceae bacterium]|nr:pyrimidine 5'-nucleotidase [Stellaceae bacterium]